MAFLRITGSDLFGPERDLVLPDGPLTIGRERDNGLVLDSNQISRHHVRLVRVPEGWLAEDLGSANGTYVNGVRISKHLLQEGDLIALGSMRMAFSNGDAPAVSLLPIAPPVPTLPRITPPPALPPPPLPGPPPLSLAVPPPSLPRPASGGGGKGLMWALGGCGVLLLLGVVAGIVFLPQLKQRFAPVLPQASVTVAPTLTPSAPIQAVAEPPTVAWDTPAQDPQGERALPSSLSGPLPLTPGQGFTPAGQLQVASKGGTYALDTFAPALRGARLEVPQGAYPSGATLRLFMRPDLPLRLDSRFSQATPVLRVDGPPGAAAKPMRMSFPVACGPDEFALPCYVDLGTGQLHPMTRLGQSDGKVTALVRHFCDTVVVKAKIVELENGGLRVETGFLPSANGWPFDNEGSIANRLAGVERGNCEGMVLGASWAFRLARTHPLMRLGDNLARSFRTPRLPQDDARGLYFVGRIQGAYAPSGQAWDAYSQERWEAPPAEHWLAIRAGLLLTGQPQVVSVYEVDNAGSIQAAHAVLAYAYSPAQGKVNIYDPNAVGDDSRALEYDLAAKAFKPYRSGKTKNDTDRMFNRIIFTCDEDWVPWPEVHRTGVEVFCDGRIPPGALPDLTVQVREEGPNGTLGTAHPLSLEPRGPMPLLRVTAKRMALTVRAGRAGVEVHHREMVLDSGTGTTWVTEVLGSADAPGWIDLKKGPNILGVSIEGKLPADDRWLWSGWQWFVVVLGDPPPKPKPTPPKRHYSRRSY